MMRSDNGTNLTGGEREIREAINSWNQQKIEGYLHQKNIDWKFNPPGVSFMGGIWERVTRSVRKILGVLLSEQLVSEEALRTLMAEVEGILNGRPLIPNSDSSIDAEPLTPNHLLLLRPNSNLPPGTFEKNNLYCQRRWKQVQYLANAFGRDGCRNTYQAFKSGRNGSSHVVILLWATLFSLLMKEFIVANGLQVAFSKFTQERMDLSDQSRLSQSRMY